MGPDARDWRLRGTPQGHGARVSWDLYAKNAPLLLPASERCPPKRPSRGFPFCAVTFRRPLAHAPWPSRPPSTHGLVTATYTSASSSSPTSQASRTPEPQNCPSTCPWGPRVGDDPSWCRSQSQRNRLWVTCVPNVTASTLLSRLLQRRRPSSTCISTSPGSYSQGLKDNPDSQVHGGRE